MTAPNERTIGYRVTLTLDAPLGNSTRQSPTSADGQGVSVSPVVTVRIRPSTRTG